MRKLASVQRIWNIEPIEGADRIEKVSVLGWKCVANKGQFKPMDLCVYFEIDSFLPIRKEFEFLGSNSYRKTDVMGEGYRIRTMKFKDQISQGLVLPVSLFPEIPKDVSVGTDVTDVLGVRKWEIEQRVTTGGTAIGGLPAIIPHTDELRIQSCPEILSEFSDVEYYISTKMDGSSHSVGIDESGFHVTGHNFEYKDDGTSSFYEFVKDKRIREKLERYFCSDKKGIEDSIVVQGEFCGPGIQQNRLRLIRPEWYVFTVIENGRRVGLRRMSRICELLDLTMVPIEEIGRNLPEKYPSVESILDRADGEYPNGGKKEGIVVRTTDPVYSSTIGGPLSFKAVSNKYLLKYD